VPDTLAEAQPGVEGILAKTFAVNNMVPTIVRNIILIKGYTAVSLIIHFLACYRAPFDFNRL